MPDDQNIVITDTPKNIREMLTDPAFLSFLGVIAIFVPFVMAIWLPIIKEIYAYYVGGVVALVGTHSANDYFKTKNLNA